ncbi:MAG: response regulator [candidate division Zixibacteria bacterium]|nr:response regulator [candidate division Zixibacteria bacterium]
MGGNASIIIVEDEIIVARNIEERLKDLGYKIMGIVSTAEDAIKQAALLKPDLVLMDIRLHDRMNGIDAAKKIYLENDIPVIFLTAYADDDTLEKAKDAEPYGYLVKPFETKELYTTIEISLRKHKKSKALTQRNDWLVNVLSNIGNGVIVTDTDGNINFINQTAEVMTGWKASEAFGKKLKDVLKIIDSVSRKIIEIPAQKSFAERYIPHMISNTTLLSRNGDHTLIDYHASLIRGEEGSILGQIWVIYDTTSTKLIEEQREKLIKHLQEALSKIRALSGLIPICSTCKKIRNKQGEWSNLEEYIQEHSEADFSYCLCPECVEDLESKD